MKKSIDIYRQEIAQYPLLSKDEETVLVEKMEKGDAEAREALINSNLRLVFLVAKRFLNRGLDMDDLVMEGNAGLIRATEDFDSSKGNRFSTYAHDWIFQSIQRAVENTGRTVRVPVHVQGEMRKVAKAKATLRGTLLREPTTDEIGESLSASRSEVESLIANYMSNMSFDAKVKEDSDLTFGDLMASRGASPEETFMNLARQENLRKAVSSLKDIQAKVITLLYGLDGGEPKTLEAAGAVLGYTKERVRQLEKVALERLRVKLAE